MCNSWCSFGILWYAEIPSVGVLVVGDGVLVVGDGVLVVGDGVVPSNSNWQRHDNIEEIFRKNS